MDIFQRNSMALGPSQVAPVSLGQYGLPRPELTMTSPMNTAGGLPLPDLGTGAPLEPPQNFLSQAELDAMSGRQKYGSGWLGTIANLRQNEIFGPPPKVG